MTEPDQAPPGADILTRRIAYAGMVPFVVLAPWLYGLAPGHPWRAATIALLTGYSVLVLAFLGGSRWGLALADQGDDGRRDRIVATLPVLTGWLALFLPAPYAFGLLAVACAAQGAWDAFAANSGILPQWYGKLRMRLTLIMVAAMVVALAATA